MDPPNQPDANRSQPWSYRIAVVAGVPIQLHVSFVLFLIWVAVGSLGGDRASNLMFVLILFFCVSLHELGHTLVALHYGIRVSGITLYPIGGVSRIEGRAAPAQEVWITLAGPMVNLGIAVALGVVALSTGHLASAHQVVDRPNDWLVRAIGANMVLALFNMIPAFPMDGGRILRALLSLGMPVDRATRAAAAVGQALAAVAGIVAVVTGQVLLLVVALFVYWGAGQEAQSVQREALVENVEVREAMMTDLLTLPHGATYRDAADLLLASSQHDFPVVLADEVHGLLTRTSLLRGLAAEGPGGYVAGAMDREFPRVGPNDDLAQLLHQMLARPTPALVFENDRLIGMVTSENLMEFMTIRRITGRRVPDP